MIKKDESNILKNLEKKKIMPIDKYGNIIPSEKSSKKKEVLKKVKNTINNVAMAGLIVSVVGLIFQKNSYDIQKKYYETYIDKLVIDLKKENPQIKTSYLRCGFTHLDVIYRNEDYKILSNEISNLYYAKDNRTLINDRDVLKELFNIRDKGKWVLSDVIFLNIESFGNRNMNNMKVIMDKVTYKNDMDCRFNRFSDLNLDTDKIISNDQKVIDLGDRRAGENILIPVVLTYEVYNDFNEEAGEIYNKLNKEIDEDFYIYNFPEDTFIYKIAYIPKFVEYYDSISSEEIVIEIRDLLENSIEINVAVSEQG